MIDQRLVTPDNQPLVDPTHARPSTTSENHGLVCKTTSRAPVCSLVVRLLAGGPLGDWMLHIAVRPEQSGGWPPANQRLPVCHPLIQPAWPSGCPLFLPERSLGLQVIHDELASLKGLAPVSRCRQHEHNRVTCLKPADSVNDSCSMESE